MRILLHSYLLDPGSGGVKRNREVIKYWKKYVDEILYIPLLGDIKRAAFDETFRKKMDAEIKSLGLSVPEKVNELIDDKRFLRGIKTEHSKIGYDFYANFLYYEYNHKVAKYLGKIPADVYYAQQEFPQMVHFISEIASNANVGALIHIENFYDSLFSDIRHFYMAYSSLGLLGIAYSLYVAFFRANPRRRKWQELINEGKVRFAFSVSEDLSSFYPFMGGIYTRVLRPANAFDKSLLKLRDRDKEDYAVFYARLSPAKGILEIPKIARKLGKKIIVLGRFTDGKFERKFMREKGSNVEYLGYVTNEKLQDIVSKAKVLIYPSHSDSFSLVILESLAMGTPVVAYRIPGIRAIYDNLPAVKLVKEGNLEEMVSEAKKIFSMPKDEFNAMMNERNLIAFLEEHSSWEKVALNELEELRRVAKIL